MSVSATGLPPRYTSIDIFINTNRNLIARKTPCFLYDKMIYTKLTEMIDDNKKRNYYKELFEDRYDGSTDLTNDIIDDFYDKDSNDLVFRDIHIEEKFQQGEQGKTLFVIPVTFNYGQLSNKREKNNKFMREIVQNIFEEEELKIFLQSSNNIYFLPCLMGKKQNLSENEYITRLQQELFNLKQHIDDQFGNVIRKGFANDDYRELYKQLSFFYNPNGNISLEFYKKKSLYNKEKNIEFLNKYLFRQLSKISASTQYERNLVIDEKIYVNPLFASNENYNGKYIIFLIRKLFELEILSELDLKQIESFYDDGIRPLAIIYKKTIKLDLYDFDTNKLNSSLQYKFNLDNGDDYIILEVETNYFKQKYYKIKKLTPARGGGGSDIIKEFEDDDYQGSFYLKITSSGVLKKATISIKNVNIYKKIMKGVLTIHPDTSEEQYKLLEPTNLVRNIQSKRIYYIENFDFTLPSLKDFFKTKNNINNNDEQNNSKIDLRSFFINIFTNKTLLNDYFLFCLNSSKHKKSIDYNFYNGNSDTKSKNQQVKGIINQLTKELMKKGSPFYANVKRETGGDLMQTLTATRRYNKYVIKNIVNGEVNVKMSSDRNPTAIDDALSGASSEERKILTDNQGKTVALVRIRLEEGDEEDKKQTNNNTNMIELIKPSNKKCYTRKKNINKQLKKLFKNFSQKIHFKFRKFI